MQALWAGIGWHMVGAASAASFYAPIEKVKKWSWETSWAVAGICSWILLPISVSLLLLPDFWDFYGSVNTGVLWKAALFGAMWGIGNVSYGLTMRHLGISLGIGVAIGINLVVGTLMPAVLYGQAAVIFATRGGLITLAGMLVALIGVAVVSYAGHQKEIQVRGQPTEFNLKLGLLLAGLCGIFSSGMSFAIDAAKPMETAALHLGVNPLYAALPSYVVIMGAGAIVNFSYCFIRLAFLQKISLRDDLGQPGDRLLKNGCLATAAGVMWYLQFFFYAWGAANIAPSFGYVNWMLHMSGYVLFGGLVGLVLGEWAGVGSRPVWLLWVGMIIIIAAANLVGFGLAS